MGEGRRDGGGNELCNKVECINAFNYIPSQLAGASVTLVREVLCRDNI